MVDHDRDSKDAALAAYRARWEQRAAANGRHGADYGPVAELAWNLAHTTGIQYGRSWADVAPEFERQWVRRDRGPGWDSVAELMREVWEDASDHGRRILEGDRRAPEPERHAPA